MFASLGDPVRVRIVELLAEKPMAVHQLSTHFPISRPAISRHLRVLKVSGVVREQRQGRENLYILEQANIDALSRWFHRFWNDRLSQIKSLAEQNYKEDSND
jgi:DNA-binding transcriptional ArsR family regulator